VVALLVIAVVGCTVSPPATPARPTEAPKTSAPTALARSSEPLERIGGLVIVLGSWSGSEQDSFMAMVRPFEEQTGIRVAYEGTRDLNTVLAARLQSGNPPDVAGLPGPGPTTELARQGKLVDLRGVLDQTLLREQYADDWINLGTVEGKQIGIFIRAAIKGPIWYNVRELPRFTSLQAPTTWDELLALSDKIVASGTAPWCIGLESGGASGWPGTDWIEDIVLRQAGPERYDQWWQGQLSWSSPEIKAAWQSWGRIVGNDRMVYGGKQAMLTTNFADAGSPLFSSPPRCYLHHQASFITDFFVKNDPRLKPVDDFNFFPFPDIDPRYSNAAEVSGDLFGIFNDTPQARALIKYLTTAEAQSVWVKRGGTISPNKQVPLSTYPNTIARQQAQALTGARTIRFDASDLMPEAMNAAFLRATIDYTQTPTNLDTILANLDRVQRDAYR
jgi:alpha-glucoside transport system substrate-binding protein